MEKDMPKEILLLTDPAMAGLLSGELAQIAPGLLVTVLTTQDQVVERFDRSLSGAQMIAAGTGVILTEKQLAALDGPAYNLHPGPPEYPGLFPSVFALYDGARQFGTTVHQMTVEVDQGPIVAVERFQIPPDADRMTLDQLSLRSLIEMFTALMKRMLSDPAHIKPCGEKWGSRRWTKADFNALCRLPDKVSEAEFLRRYRAIGEGPGHALELMLHGHRFILDNQRATQPVYVAGIAADRDSSA